MYNKIYTQPIDMSAACCGFGYRQVFTARLRMSNFFLFKIFLDTFVFVLRKQISIVAFKKLTQAFSISVAVFYCFLRYLLRIRKGQGKPLTVTLV